MHLRSRVVLAAAAAFACVAACGGPEFVAGGDGGAQGQGSSSGTDASGCVTAPATTGGEAAFCALETKLFTQCGQCETCRQTDLNNCVSLGDSLSSAFKSALGTCENQIPCGDYSTYGNDPCVSSALVGSTKSTAQIAAATQYCSKCAGSAAGVTTCVTDFFQPPQPDGGSAGVGYIVLLSSDAIASSIATTCSSTCSPGLYELCAIGQFCKTQQADACKTGYCGK